MYVLPILDERKSCGEIVTKHDQRVSERKNARNLEQVLLIINMLWIKKKIEFCFISPKLISPLELKLKHFHKFSIKGYAELTLSMAYN